jgi:hypothetical protein
MSAADPGTDPHSSVPPIHSRARHLSFWIRELPFSIVLILTLVGVAYISFSKKPITGYWEILAPLIALICVGYGWHAAPDTRARLWLIVKQVLHWLAFLVVMNIVLLSSVQRMYTATSTGLTIFTLLALGTFTAGVQVLSWQVCLLGLIMALGTPAIAWVENSALIFLLLAGVIVGIGAVVWWHVREWRGHHAVSGRIGA